jgi:SRSO17 transposase
MGCATPAGNEHTICQALVSLTLVKDEVPVPIVLRRSLPDTWIKDPDRLQHAGVPEVFWTELFKLEELSICCKRG